MKVIEGDNSYFFDCDDTLVMWDNKHKTEDNVMIFDCYGSFESLAPNWSNIRFLKETKRNQGTVVVWSAGGWEWALEVVTVLGLKDYVDCVMSKPQGYIDDLNCVEFMGPRYYKEPNE